MPSRKKISKSKEKDALIFLELQADRERLFKEYSKYLHRPWSIIWRNFLAGAFHGLGFILGTAILLGFITFIFGKLLGVFPFLTDLSDALKLWMNTIKDSTP